MSHQPAQVAPSNENKMALSLSFSLSFCDKWCSSGCLPDVWPGWSPRPEPGSYYFLFFALFWLRKIFFFCLCVCGVFFGRPYRVGLQRPICSEGVMLAFSLSFSFPFFSVVSEVEPFLFLFWTWGSLPGFTGFNRIHLCSDEWPRITHLSWTNFHGNHRVVLLAINCPNYFCCIKNENGNKLALLHEIAVLVTRDFEDSLNDFKFSCNVFCSGFSTLNSGGPFSSASPGGGGGKQTSATAHGCGVGVAPEFFLRFSVPFFLSARRFRNMFVRRGRPRWGRVWNIIGRPVGSRRSVCEGGARGR